MADIKDDIECECPGDFFNLANLLDIEISEELREKICFRESLIISKLNDDYEETPSPVGGMCLDVQTAEDNKFCIYVSTRFNFNNAQAGSKITTWADPDLHTIEEKRKEYVVSSESGNKTQQLYIAAQKDYLYITHRILPDEEIKKRCPLQCVNKLIGEGVNFVLMRLLAIHIFIGEFEMSTLYINGDLCRNIYTCLGPEGGMVNNVKTDICRIKRTIIEQCGIVHQCISILTLDGKMVKQEWKDCKYVIHLNPLQDLTAATIAEMVCGCENKLPLSTTWRDDIQLMAEYLDRRQLIEREAKYYVHYTKQLNNLMTDYVKAVLQHKPRKVLDFSIAHFLKYAHDNI